MTVAAVVERESIPQVFIPQLVKLWRQGHRPVRLIRRRPAIPSTVR